MQFALDDQQRLLVRTIRDFVKRELMPLEDRVEADGFLADDIAAEIQQKSRDLGLYAVNIPTAYGGGGLSVFDWMLAEEQYGYTSDILIRRAFGNVYEILLEGNAEQIETYLLPTVRGERTCSVAFTEPAAGSDAASIKTRAVRDGDDWILNGAKHFISDGLYSDFFVVTAVTDPDAGYNGISTFIVEKGMSGFNVGRDQPMMGLRGTSHVEMSFDDVRLSQAHLLGPEGKGLKMALSTLGRVRLAQVAARATGKATHIMDLMLEHARERKQFGAQIGTFQMVQQMLADSAMDINATRLALWQTASRIDNGEDPRANISMLKVQAAEMLGHVVDRAVQIFGGMGYCRDLPIERYYRDARIYRIYDGASEIHRVVMAKSLMKGDTSLYSVE
ncbi:acyl-CoA dehydrogenase family protein [Candidatus Puniceispirillum marinum]|uniref:Acyl-CoA dehydrogenase domain protein n=1 Tax=Puniceispirillum marinum (strain IMCC1322) TaxID=488538 RepID=D5BSB8_PUNMI|nr:acyl-CoA dehydrogenase family protein [Candidatus Puniceispirillum marinum]ADE39165.1 acyl-CoA dehydrogenase domain protein [Candidatus Puniceispirillum marinum IMCC1322]